MTRAIEPLALFLRICVRPPSDTSLENYFQFELSPYLLSLFDKTGMRKTRKSELYSILQECDVHISSRDRFVIDGSFLLHHVLWTRRGKTFKETTTTYVSYIEKTLRWYTKCVPDIIIHGDNTITVSQELLLSNSNNKRQFIQLLCVKLWRRYMRLLVRSFVHKLNKYCEKNMSCKKANLRTLTPFLGSMSMVSGPSS